MLVNKKGYQKSFLFRKVVLIEECMVKRDSGELLDLNSIEVVFTTFLCKWTFKKLLVKLEIIKFIFLNLGFILVLK